MSVARYWAVVGKQTVILLYSGILECLPDRSLSSPCALRLAQSMLHRGDRARIDAGTKRGQTMSRRWSIQASLMGMLLVLTSSASAQNTFPSSGNVGIGT